MIEWKRTVGHLGIPCWESALGRAYSSECPPTSAPLTRAQVSALPNGTPVIVMWGGGNGPHRYVYRDGCAVMPDVPDWNSDDGELDCVGGEPMQHKVWIDTKATP